MAISNKCKKQFDWFVQEALYNYFVYGKDEVDVIYKTYSKAKEYQYKGRFVINLNILDSKLLNELYS